VEEDHGTDPTLADTDGDGLSDGDEVNTYGTLPNQADTDGDGLKDGEEIDCVSDPLDAEELCYSCGWGHNDPENLQSTGSSEGDTLVNLGLIDQCEEDVSLWDFAGSYHILFMTTQWCTACLSEASDLQRRTEEFVEESGIPFSYMILLSEDTSGNAPNGNDASGYAEEVNAETVPVLASGDQGVLTATPWTGSPLPGKCLISPDMVMLDCYSGHGDDADAFDTIMELEALE
jgi:hypothetical protein